MAERFTAEIAIGGPVPASLVDGLLEAIQEEGLHLDWELSDFDATNATELLEAARDGDTPGPLRLMDHEVAWGQFGNLEAFLQEHQIAFDRWSDGKYEYDPVLTQFRPGMTEPYVCLTNHSKEPLILKGSVIAALEALQKNEPAAAVRVLKEALGPEIEPLGPLQISPEPPPSAAPFSTLNISGPVDWELLSRQKMWLLQHAQASAEAAGLIEFLDAIQDAAADGGGVPEAVVFPNLQERKDSDGHVDRDHSQQ